MDFLFPTPLGPLETRFALHDDRACGDLGPFFAPREDEQGTLHLELDPNGRSIEVGVRLCAAARPWLEAHGSELSGAPGAEERLIAVGRRWGSAAAPLLEELAAAHPRERAFGWLLAGARR